MFGWGRKKDGFVWHEYVRTTILVRRDQRRQKVEDIRLSALDTIKQASKQGLAIGLIGSRAASRNVVQGLQAAYYWISDAIVVGADATRLWLADRMHAWELDTVAQELGTRWSQAAHAPNISTPTLLVGAVCAASAIMRVRDHGFDLEATITTTLAVVALLGVAVPRLAALIRARGLIGSGGARSWMGSAAKIGALVLAAVWIVRWIVPALTSGPAGLIPQASEGQHVLTSTNGQIEARAVVLSGDQMRVGGALVRLFGIEAPEAGQNCAGPGGKSTSCGATAKAALQRLVAGKQVVCEVSGRQSESNATATCRINGADIAGQLVRGGQVFATTGLFATYASAEREARAARAGVWRTDVARPAEFRAKVWDEAKDAAPDGCPIKAVVSGDTKTYLLPWSANYERTKVKTSRGERWFCTEAEARAAGWKPAEPG